MADDSYTEVTSRSWFSRLGQSIGGVLFGLLLLLGGGILLFTNEGRSVATAKALEEGLGLVKSIDAGRILPENEGSLVHLTGLADTQSTVTDAALGVSARALRLRRTVEMYQWRENTESRTHKTVGGGETTETTYTYTKTWSDTHIDSSHFKKPDGHANPASMPYDTREFTASKVTLGAFVLPARLVDDLTAYEPLVVEVPPTLRGKATASGSGFFVGTNPAEPQIGDLTIRWDQVQPQEVSVYAAQAGNTLAPFKTKNGRSLERIQTGVHSAPAMFEQAVSENVTLTWVLRALGFLLLFIGFALAFRPISVLLDVLPFLGNLAEVGLGLAAFVLALALGLIIVGVAWFFYRPLLALVLIALALAAFYGLARRRPKAA